MNCREVDFIKTRVIVGKTQTQVKETEESRRQCSFCVTPANGRGGKNNNKTKIQDRKGKKTNQLVDIKAPKALALSQHKSEEDIFPPHVHLS